ncbi:hypothetical protein [Microbacterium sp. gxy059]|uniref:hypothetical protein n=1 Tax=Microbacterium sp. gxy059 TaxID=2957199 RepID=UPI003D97CCB6
MSSPRTRREGEGPPILVLLAFAAFGFLALLVCGLGFASLATDEDVIATPGVWILSGYVAAGVAVAAFALLLWGALAPTRPSYLAVIGIALAVPAAHALALAATAVLGGSSVGVAIGAAGDVLVGWVSPTVAVAAAVASWAAIAMRRTRARPPRWPWEDDDADE